MAPMKTDHTDEEKKENHGFSRDHHAHTDERGYGKEEKLRKPGNQKRIRELRIRRK